MGIQDALRTLNSQAEAQMRSKEKLISDKAQEVFSAMCQAIAKEISSSNGSKYRIEGQLKPYIPLFWHTDPKKTDVPVFATITYSYSSTLTKVFSFSKGSLEGECDLSINSTDAWISFLNALNSHIRSEKGLSCRIYLDYQPFPVVGKEILLWNSEYQPRSFNIHNPYNFKPEFDYDCCRFDETKNEHSRGYSKEGRLISGSGHVYLMVEYTYCMS